MIHDKKLYNDLREWFLEKHGNLFRTLSEQDQHKMITSIIQNSANKMKIDIE